jgi:hypothetical protein
MFPSLSASGLSTTWQNEHNTFGAHHFRHRSFSSAMVRTYMTISSSYLSLATLGSTFITCHACRLCESPNLHPIDPSPSPHGFSTGHIYDIGASHSQLLLHRPRSVPPFYKISLQNRNDAPFMLRLPAVPSQPTLLTMNIFLFQLICGDVTAT